MKWLKVLLTGILVSMFYFPFEFTFLPGINTKMMLAVVGLALILYSLVQKRELSLPRSLLILLLLSAAVSMISLFSITYNDTPDTTYVSYIVSATVWLSAAYVVCRAILLVHDSIDVPIIVYYLTGVCVFQCIIALVIDYNPPVQQFVDRYIVGGAFFHHIHRLYGIGAGLDVAGTRFACTLVGIASLLALQSRELPSSRMIVLFLSFCVITVIGNMIARTTLVGTAIGLGILLVFGTGVVTVGHQGTNPRKLFLAVASILLVGIPLVVFFYQTNDKFFSLMRFGFEGFFSLVETGEWHVSSNDMLEKMVVWPDELKTWIIGDGYFVSERIDPNYLGPVLNAGYYKGTDIGYCRFIFYIGIIGLVAISTVMAYASAICCMENKTYTLMFLLALLAGFIMWGKAATDVFLFFAIFICASYLRNKQSEPEEEEPGSDTAG